LTASKVFKSAKLVKSVAYFEAAVQTSEKTLAIASYGSSVTGCTRSQGLFESQHFHVAMSKGWKHYESPPRRLEECGNLAGKARFEVFPSDSQSKMIKMSRKDSSFIP